MLWKDPKEATPGPPRANPGGAGPPGQKAPKTLMLGHQTLPLHGPQGVRGSSGWGPQQTGTRVAQRPCCGCLLLGGSCPTAYCWATPPDGRRSALTRGCCFCPGFFSITERGYPAFYCFSPPANLGAAAAAHPPLISPKRAMASDVVLPSSDPRIWEKYRGAGFPKSQGGVHSGRLN